MLNLNLLGIEKGYLLEAGYLSLTVLKNYIFLSLQLHSVAKTQQDLQTLLPLVSSDRRAEAKAFNQALCDFAAGDYPQSIQGFQAYSFQLPEYQLMAQLKTLHAYYHLSQAPAPLDSAEYASLRSQLQRLERHLRLFADKDLSKRQKTSYRNHLRLFRQLMRRPEGEKLARLRKRIKTEKSLSGRDWLLRQVEKLA